MRIQTRGNSTTVWLCSDIGVIDGTMTMSAPTLEKILQAVNEKYGTSFEGWSQLPTAYEVGDSVPNWNAYEKIFNPFIGLEQAGEYILGHIVESEIKILVNNEDWYIITDNEGKCSTFWPPGDEQFVSDMIQVVNSVTPFNINSVSIEAISIEIGETVPNFNKYTKYHVSI